MDSPHKKSLLLTLLSPKVGLPLFAALAVLFGPFVYRSAQLAGLPDPGDPFDVEAFGTVEIEPEENAFVEYRAAQALAKPIDPGFDGDLSEVFEAGWEAAPDVIRNWVEDNRRALQIWHKGTEKPDALYHQPRDMTIETLLEVTQELRNFARLSRMEASRMEEVGDVAEAWQWHRATFRSSRHSGRNACMIDRLVGIAMHAIVSEGVIKWSQRATVDESLLEQALREITQDYEMTAAESTWLKVEYLMLLKLLQSPDLWEAVTLSARVSSTGYHRAVERAEWFLKNEPELSLRITRHVFGNILEEIDRPLAERTKRVGSRVKLFAPRTTLPGGDDRLTSTQIEAAVLRSVVATMILPAIEQVDVAHRREQARQAALRVCLSAQIYARRHGGLPDNPQQLLDDGILDQWPTDPNSPTGAALNYRRDGDEAVVWSVGEDGVDDGGTVQVEAGLAPDDGIQIRAPGTLANSTSR